MKEVREPKMTIVCKHCEEHYGIWRARCPVCGTGTPDSVRKAMLETPRTIAKRPKRISRNRPTCVFCHLESRKFRKKCPECDEPIHDGCLTLHVDSCKRFQEERRSAINALTNPGEVAKRVNDLIGRR